MTDPSWSLPVVPASPPAYGYPPRSPGLEVAIAQHVAAGWRVEALTPTTAALVSGKQPNHILHALLSFFTCGAWLPIWLILALATREVRTVLGIDGYGQVTRHGGAPPSKPKPLSAMFSEREKWWYTAAAVGLILLIGAVIVLG